MIPKNRKMKRRQLMNQVRNQLRKLKQRYNKMKKRNYN